MVWISNLFGSTSYISLIEDFLSRDYLFKTFTTDLDSKSICMRHDIDFSIIKAYEIAKLEKELGIKSTFFFMLTSNFYNIFSKENYEIISRIYSLGHDISLHFDPDCYGNSILEKSFLKEKNTFESFFRIDIKIISLHRPRHFLNNNNKKLPSSLHTYEDRFFKQMYYLSDSSGSDLIQKISNFDFNKCSKPFHLLTHPIWWTSSTNSPTETLNLWSNDNNQYILNEIKKNCKSFII